MLWYWGFKWGLKSYLSWYGRAPHAVLPWWCYACLWAPEWLPGGGLLSPPSNTHTHSTHHTLITFPQISSKLTQNTSPMRPFSHLLLLLSPQLFHLWPMLRLQVFCLCWVTLPKPLLHSGQLRLLLHLQLLQLSLKRHLQCRLFPLEPLPPRWVGCCLWSVSYDVISFTLYISFHFSFTLVHLWPHKLGSGLIHFNF